MLGGVCGGGGGGSGIYKRISAKYITASGQKREKHELTLSGFSDPAGRTLWMPPNGIKNNRQLVKSNEI